MAIKRFIDLNDLTIYDSLIKSVISEEDAKSIKAASFEGKKLNLYTQENPTSSDTPRFSIALPFTIEEINGPNGKARIYNESDGGGISFERNNGLKSFVGVNDGDAGEIAAQIYAVDTSTKKGSRINVTTTGIYYTNGVTSPAYTSDDELVTRKDLSSGAGGKTVYLKDESSGQSDYAKVYRLYQGSDASDMTQNTLVGAINIPKDLVVKSGSVRTVTIAGEPYEGAKPGDKFIDLEIQNQSEHLYIPVNSLIDVYTGGITPEITVSVDSNNVITATITELDGSKLVDGSVERIKLATDVTDSLDLADTALQSDDIDSVDESDIRSLFGQTQAK